MISDRLRELITPYLLLELEDWEKKYVDDMFSEVYKYVENGEECVGLKPIGEDYLTILFSTLNGAYVAMAFWDEVKTKGELL